MFKDMFRCILAFAYPYITAEKASIFFYVETGSKKYLLKTLQSTDRSIHDRLVVFYAEVLP